MGAIVFRFIKFFVPSMIVLFGGSFAQCLAVSDNVKRMLIVCDVYKEGIGGTETVLREIKTGLSKINIVVDIIDVSELSLNLCASQRAIANKIQNFRPDYVFISLLGIMSCIAMRYCFNNNIPFTTFCSVHIPKLYKKVAYMPEFMTSSLVNNYLLPKASNILVPTDSFKAELDELGLDNVQTWTHGIDLNRFTLPRPEEKELARIACNLQDKKRPFYLYVAHVSKIKNIPAFLDLDLPGTKIVVGDENIGCSIADLQECYPDVLFTGAKSGADLVNYYHASDIFVFPSKLDTFGLVILEALACGLPIVGFDVTGPKDVVPAKSGVSYLAQTDQELQVCALQAWNELCSNTITPEQCHTYASKFSWNNAIDLLIKNLVQIDYDKYVEPNLSYGC